jgi:hypothetical protein
MRYKKATGLENSAEFFCPPMAKEKDGVAKIEVMILENISNMKKVKKIYTELIIERFQETDFSMDFLSTSKRIAM